VGNDAKTKHIIHHMNKKCNNDYPNCPFHGSFKLTNYHFWHFFHKIKGKLNCPTSKPCLSPENKKKQMKFARRIMRKLERTNEVPFHYCFLDEKWFYVTSR
jgi:hypothetical protein